jgi:formylglycine-generating enzyme required for sulfatase activity
MLENHINNSVKDALGIEFVKIPQGSFMMGSPENEIARFENEKLHEVNIAHDFYLSKQLVTQAQWLAIMGSNPSYFEGDNLPVEQVSWLDVQAFIAQLNQKTGQNYRLPTEAEWEYACRAGTSSPFYTGDVMTDKDANFNNPDAKTTPVGSYPANPWGLHDMAGNVWEWTASAYDADYKFSERCAGNNDVNISCVLRGGSWDYGSGNTRSAARINGSPGYSSDFIGFRLALDQTD